MINNDHELQGTLERIEHFRRQLEHLRKVEMDAVSLDLAASGYIAELERMQKEVRDYLSLHPA